MVHLAHEDLDKVIWGDAASRVPTDAALSMLVRNLQVVWSARLALWVVQSWIDAAWSTDTAKATGILLLLYALSFFLYMRGRHALNFKLLLLVGVVGLCVEVAKPAAALFQQSEVQAAKHDDTVRRILRVVAIFLGLVTFWCTVRIMWRIVHIMSPKKSVRKRL
ncbi:hypothetical protein H310_13173 [Aphanomyces invadans]|uniref:Uncharacterized protein n=1 Tax=Aphanomyces invadans TaxID=157072 RepID=A0A024TEQ9_9STRA|nr:hypothetical protein H310_13173 [Aphanomyces invadans]ETV92484.1 hypothetical protein H310_13173 [Aphanomyces invadans]|eukprot:XP_008878791.1 hypothetical protein H310_13173 [Aphanomyces invadans]